MSAGLPLRLRRNWSAGLAAVVTTVGLGAAIAVNGLRSSAGVPVILGAVLVIAGAVGFGPMLRRWRLDEGGVARGGRRVLTWPEVVNLEVRSFRTTRGMGPPHVDVILETANSRAVMVIYSRRDAERLHAVLAARLPAEVRGRPLLALIPGTWTAMS